MKRLYLIIEFTILFILPPILYILDYLPAPIIPILLLVAVICLIILLRDPTFDRRRLWNVSGLKKCFKRILVQFTFNCVWISAAVWILQPDNLLLFIKEAPIIWGFVMVLYPLFSVYPQELIYRAFFFHRYSSLFPNRWIMIFANALAFGYMHIIFQNYIAVILTVGGGYLFARTYDRSRSILASAVEHALYGCFVFTIGLGLYFYHGAIPR
jgi:membrane protease YdiL (CAAX protease family)